MLPYNFIDQCAPHDRVTVRTKTQPLKMILSKSAGSRFQMDLIKMPPCRGYTQILRVVDHLSKYGYVAPMKSKSATECADALVRILSGSIMQKYYSPTTVAKYVFMFYRLMLLVLYGFRCSSLSVYLFYLYGFC